MPTAVSAGLVRDWAERALQGLGEARQDIDALNVFPVPDGDTGTNLYLTLEAATQEVVRADPTTVAGAAAALARGALLGARGNSGVIVSQIVRGATEVLGGLVDGEPVSSDAVRMLLARAADLSYAAVARPVEGTILTVARQAAECAAREVDGDASAVMRAAVAGAQEALGRTTHQLDTLARAGVVDAGGAGLVVVLRALEESISGVRRHAVAPFERPSAPLHTAPEGYSGPEFEVMFLLDARDAAVDALRLDLDQMGDSLVIVGADPLWNVHVHVDDAGGAIEAAMRAGVPSRIRITHLATGAQPQQRTGRALVAVTHGPGIADLLRGSGVHVVPTAPRARPSTGELLEAVLQTHANEVLLLPSDSDVRPAAEAAAKEAQAAGVRVSVIPSRAIVQTLAAVAVHDPAQDFNADAVTMTRAAGATRYAAVTIASRAALTMAGPCEPGDVLGVTAGDIAVVGRDLEEVARSLATSLLTAGGELVTLVMGADAPATLRENFPRWLESAHPLVEVTTYDGGQPLWPLIMGVE